MRKESSDFAADAQTEIMTDVESLRVRANNLCRMRKDLPVERRSVVLQALFPAVRQQLLRATLCRPNKWWYLSELAHDLRLSCLAFNENCPPW